MHLTTAGLDDYHTSITSKDSNHVNGTNDFQKTRQTGAWTIKKALTTVLLFTKNGIETRSIHQVRQASTSVCNQSNSEG